VSQGVTALSPPAMAGGRHKDGTWRRHMETAFVRRTFLCNREVVSYVDLPVS